MTEVNTNMYNTGNGNQVSTDNSTERAINNVMQLVRLKNLMGSPTKIIGGSPTPDSMDLLGAGQPYGVSDE